MKYLVIPIILILVLTSFIYQSTFLNKQLKNKRVSVAYNSKGKTLKSQLSSHKIDWKKLEVLIVAYKNESVLYLYVKNKTDKKFRLFKEYPICANSGTLGPKRKEGDLQVPEGFYHINVFNPNSNFHMSLGINYPNKSDQILGFKENLGGAIFIHGSCVTVGCLPMTDKGIEEIYLFSVFAKNANQKNIPVYIFPFKMDKKNNETDFASYSKNKETIRFWENLQQGYSIFNSTKKALNFTINKNGYYIF